MNAALDPLELDLAALTESKGSPASVWKTAVEEHHNRRVVGKRVEIIASVALVAVIGLISVQLILPSIGGARNVRPGAREITAPRRVPAADDNTARSVKIGAGLDTPARFDDKISTPIPVTQPVPGGVRQIVRRAEIELSVTDLRDAYTKAADLIRPEFGEYIESSNYDARAYSPVARLKLRVTAERLDRALADLRSLGELTDESASGEDASARAIDLDARLANARRIETELLELMDRRADDDLADILQLRREIDDIRLQIERLEAQQATLSELVSLATITVTLRATETDEPEETAGFGALISDAFDSGITKLSASAAWIVRVIVGGIIWWTIGLVTLALSIRWARRAGL